MPETTSPAPAETCGAPGPIAPISLPQAQLAIRRAAMRLAIGFGWSVLHEFALPNGRRADIMALRPDGGFACIEVKSGPRDYLTDQKWPQYREYCDALYFAVGDDFPAVLIPDDVGLIVACLETPADAAMLREAPVHRLAGSRRRALLHRFATVAASRLACVEDPAITASFRAALRAE